MSKSNLSHSPQHADVVAKPAKILFQLSGSIAAYKACQVISRLVQAGHDVQVVCTAGALQFVGKATLEGLSGKRVFSNLYEEGAMMDHIHLARRADAAILCPASASTIARLAHGLADDAVGALYLAWDAKRPYWIAPAMNSSMIAHPAVQANLQTLRERGAIVLPSESGHQACGEVGEGRLLDPLEIEKIIRDRLEGRT